MGIPAGRPSIFPPRRLQRPPKRLVAGRAGRARPIRIRCRVGDLVCASDRAREGARTVAEQAGGAETSQRAVIFLSNLVAYADVLGAFADIGIMAGESWATAFQREAMELRNYLAKKASSLKLPEVFGVMLEGPDWGVQD
jgi:hypothetical protein